MHLDKLVKKMGNLKNIGIKVNNDKNILLISMMKLNKNLSYYVNNAISSKQMIDQISKQYNIKNAFVEKKLLVLPLFKKIKKVFRKTKELWIYLTEEQKYSTDSYSRYEKYILNEAKDINIDFIAIGQRAQDFCINNKLNLMKYLDKNSLSMNELTTKLSQIVKLLYIEQNYGKVRFVINSNKNFNSSFIILPTSEFDINKLTSNLEVVNEDFSKFKIYPNASEFVDNQANIFIENAINSLLIESSFYTTKNALVTTNKIIKDLDEQVSKLSKKIIQTKREKEIEEIVLLTRDKNNLVLDGSE